MKRFGEAEDPRRRLLIQALAAGAFAAAVPGAGVMAAELFGRAPRKLPRGQSIYRLSGNAMVNASAATMQTRIGPNDTVETAKGSEIVFAVGESAFILREESRVTLQSAQQDSLLLSGMRLLTGALLSVFPNGRPARIITATATIGIRGTGFYLEADPQQTYFCTCYGIADVAAINDPESRDTVVSRKHDKPLYVVANANRGENIRSAPFINHTDQELMLVETLVGRTPPFVFPRDTYKAPRRSY
jgi:hypothetical protein